MGDKPLDERAIFKVARTIESAEARADYFRQVCGDDEALFERLVTLLRVHDDEPEFLESIPPAFLGDDLPSDAAAIDAPPFAEKLGAIVDRYKLVHEIGQGGMGAVYLAVQEGPVQRKVALKIIKPGMDTKEVVARFEAERQALALMDHQGIAHVLDGGSTESGRPYFVMELVEGRPITEYCDEYRHTTRQRLELFVQVCQAVQHAHLKGIIHRDIKPSNILVSKHDGVAVPKVIDFGIAKALHQPLAGASVHTHASQMVGTPLYMSPEQAQRTGQDIDTRTDVYSLGVLLYELLTGTTPFDKQRLRDSELDEVKRIIREEEPPKPSTRLSTLGAALDTVTEKHHTDLRTLTRELSGELDWIVMKALEKDRVRRYESANELGKDVQRYLADEPVEACPPAVAYRLKKFYRRNKVALASAVILALTLLIGAGIATGQAIRATKAERLAKRQERLAIEQRLLAVEAAEREKMLRVEAERQRERAEAALLLALQDFNPVGATFGPDGNFYVSSYGGHRILKFSGEDGTLLGEFVTGGSGGLECPQGLTFGPDANGDGFGELYVASFARDAVLRYDGVTGVFLGAFVSEGMGGLDAPTGLTFGPDGHLYVTSFRTDSVLRYDKQTGRCLGAFVSSGSGGLSRPQMAVFGPDGNLYVASCLTDSVLRYDGSNGTFMDAFVRSGAGGLTRPEALGFGPDENLYVISTTAHGDSNCGSNVLRYDGTTGEFIDEFINRGAGGLRGGQSLVFGANGELYVTSYSNDSIPCYDRTGRFIRVFSQYDRRQLMGTLARNPTTGKSLAESYVELIGQRLRTGKEGEAFEAYREAIRLLDTVVHDYQADGASAVVMAGVLEVRGRAHFYVGQYDNALADFKKVASLSPGDAAMHKRLAWLLAASPNRRPSDARQALALASVAVRLSPTVGNYWNALGVCQYRVGNWGAARDSLEEAIRLQGENGSTGFFLSMAHSQMHNHEEARKWYNDSTQWMTENVRLREESMRYRKEAAALLGIDLDEETTRSPDDAGRTRSREPPLGDSADAEEYRGALK